MKKHFNNNKLISIFIFFITSSNLNSAFSTNGGNTNQIVVEVSTPSQFADDDTLSAKLKKSIEMVEDVKKNHQSVSTAMWNSPNFSNTFLSEFC